MQAEQSSSQVNPAASNPMPAYSPHIVSASLMRPHGQTGLQSAVWRLHEALRSQNPHCELITPLGGNPLWMAVFSVRKLLLARLNKNWSTRWYRYWHYIAFRQNLQRYLSRHHPEWIIAHCPLTALAAVELRATSQINFKVALVCHFNGSQADEFRMKGELDDEATIVRIHQIERTVLKSVDGVIYVSTWLQDVVEKEWGIAPQRSVVIWNGIPININSDTLSRHDLQFESSDVVLINVGTLEPRKNQVGLVHLFSQIHSSHPRSRLILVGDGPDRNEIEALVGHLELDRYVRILGQRADVAEILALADIYVHYSSMESFGIVFLEAARAGLPIAAPMGSGMSEVLQALEGYVVLTPESMAESLKALLPLMTSSVERKSFSERNRINFARHFSIESSASQYLHVLNAWQHHND